MKYAKLILLRHGQSQWNLENKFTGWTDVRLTQNGKLEAKNAGKLLLHNNFDAQVVFTSVLERAIQTAEICLKSLNKKDSSIIRDWRLNERHYGNLQGLNKSDTATKYGDEQVFLWRRSYDIPPPKMRSDDKRHPKNDKMYKDIDPKVLPNGESLKNTLDRVSPLWKNNILPKLKNGKNVLIVAHGNSLRAIVKMLKKTSNENILKLNIPTGVPYLFEFSNEFEIIKDLYLGNKDEILKKSNIAANQSSSKS